MGQYVDSRTQWRRQQWRWRRDPHAPPLLLLCLCVAHDFCTVTATPLDARAIMMARRTASTDQDTPTEYDAAVLRKELVQMGASDDTHPLGDCAHWVCFDELQKKYACQDTCNLACRETTLDDHVTPKCHAASGGGRLQEALADVGPSSDSSHALSLQASGGSSSSSFLTPLSSGRSAFTKDSSSRPASSSMDSSQKDFYSKYFQSKPFAVDPEVSPEVYYKRDSPDGQAYLDGDMRYAPVDAMVSKKDVAADNRGHEALPVWGKFWSKGGVDEDHIALSDAERAENMYTRNSLGALLWDEERQGHRRIKVEMAPLIMSKVDSSVDTSRDSLHKKGGSFADRGSGGSLHMEQKSLDRQLLLYGESSRLSSFSKATQADGAPVPSSTMESSILSSLEPGSLSSQGSSVSATYQMIILTAAAPMFCVAVMPGCNTAFSGINVMGLLTPFLALLQSFPTTKYISEYILAGLDSYENSQKKCDGLDSYQPTKDFTCVAAMAPEGCGLDASTDWATLPVNYTTVNLEECSALACNNNYTGFVFRTWANSICEASDCSNHSACAYSNCSGNMTCSESTWSGGCLLLKNNKCTGNEYDGSILQPKEGSAVYYKTDREDVSSLMQYCILVVIVHVLLRYLVVGNLGTGLYTEDPIETTDEDKWEKSLSSPSSSSSLTSSSESGKNSASSKSSSERSAPKIHYNTNQVSNVGSSDAGLSWYDRTVEQDSRQSASSVGAIPSTSSFAIHGGNFGMETYNHYMPGTINPSDIPAKQGANYELPDQPRPPGVTCNADVKNWFSSLSDSFKCNDAPASSGFGKGPQSGAEYVVCSSKEITSSTTTTTTTTTTEGTCDVDDGDDDGEITCSTHNGDKERCLNAGCKFSAAQVSTTPVVEISFTVLKDCKSGERNKKDNQCAFERVCPKKSKLGGNLPVSYTDQSETAIKGVMCVENEEVPGEGEWKIYRGGGKLDSQRFTSSEDLMRQMELVCKEVVQQEGTVMGASAAAAPGVDGGGSGVLNKIGSSFQNIWKRKGGKKNMQATPLEGLPDGSEASV